MATEIGALRALLSLDSAAFERGAKRAEASMSNLQRRLRHLGKGMEAIGKRMAVGVTTPLAIASGAMLRSSMATIDAQSKMAQSLGTSTKSMQVLARAADRAGISSGELEQIGTQLTKRLSEAASGGGTAAKALEKLGIKVADLSAMDLDQKILTLNRAIEDHVPAAERAAVAAALFGARSGLIAGRLDAATIAAAADEIDRFGLAVTELEADSIEEANDAISALGLVTRGLGNQLAVALAPALQRLAELVADAGAWFASLSPKMRQFMGVAVALAGALGPVLMALGFMATGLAALASPVGLVVVGLAAAAGAAALVAAHWDDLKSRFPALQKMADLGETVAAAWSDLPAIKWATLIPALRWASFIPALGWLRFIPAISWRGLAGAMSWGALINPIAWLRFVPVIGWASLVGSLAWSLIIKPLGWDKYLPRIDWSSWIFTLRWGDFVVSLDWSSWIPSIDWGNWIPEINWTDWIPEFDWDAIFGRSESVGRKGRNLGRNVGKNIAEGTAAGIVENSDKVEGASSGMAKKAIGAAEAAADIRSPSREFMRIGRQMMEGAAIGIDRAAGLAAGAAGKAASLIGDTMSAATEGTGLASVEKTFKSIGDAIGGVIARGESLGDSLRGVFQGIASDLVSSGFETLLKSLFSGLSIGGGGGGGFLSSLFGGFRADGGPVSAAKSYIVGERGPELFTPGRSGSIIPNHALSGASHGQARSIHVTVSGARGNQEIMDMVGRGVRQGLSQYDATLPDRVSGIQSDPRARF